MSGRHTPDLAVPVVSPAPPTVAELAEAHGAALYRVAYRYCGNAADAEDLVQETFVVACRKLDQLRERAAARAWLAQVLRNLWVRARKRPAPTLSPEAIAAAAAPVAAPEPFDRDRLLALLDRMPDDFREPLLLFYFEDFKYREIADILGVPIGTVMSRLARGKAYLRERFVLE